jgi:hypothetical protein
MNSAFASRLVRSWVGAYTRGLPDEIGLARRDEIESDLWSQNEDAVSFGRSDAALAAEMLGRLVRGIPADLVWRLDHGRPADRTLERSANLGTKIVALMAIVGGLGVMVGVGRFVIWALGHPDTGVWDLNVDQSSASIESMVSQAGLVAVALSLGGLAFVLIDRMPWPIALAAVLGMLGAFVGLLGGYTGWIMLPVGSIVVAPYLAWIHAVRRWVAFAHAASAVGLFLLIGAFLTNAVAAPGAAILTVAYPISWIGIGLELLRGIPHGRSAAPPMS